MWIHTVPLFNNFKKDSHLTFIRLLNQFVWMLYGVNNIPKELQEDDRLYKSNRGNEQNISNFNNNIFIDSRALTLTIEQ